MAVRISHIYHIGSANSALFETVYLYLRQAASVRYRSTYMVLAVFPQLIRRRAVRAVHFERFECYRHNFISSPV